MCFFHFEGHSQPAVRQHILIDIYLINELLYNLNLVQVQQYTKLNYEVHGVFHFPIDSVLNMTDSTCIQPQFFPPETLIIK